MNRKVIIGIIIFFVVILVAVAIYLIIKGSKNKKSDKSISGDESTGNIPVIPAVFNPSTGSSSSDSFPLKRGSKGPNVIMLQTALGNASCAAHLHANGLSVPVPDGSFGPKTEAALKSCYNVTSVSQALFTSITSGTTPVNYTPTASTGIGSSIIYGSSVQIGNKLSVPSGSTVDAYTVSLFGVATKIGSYGSGSYIGTVTDIPFVPTGYIKVRNSSSPPKQQNPNSGTMEGVPDFYVSKAQNFSISL